MNTYTIRRFDRGEFSVLRRGQSIGVLLLSREGLEDWTFSAGVRLPSRATQAKLLREAIRLDAASEMAGAA